MSSEIFLLKDAVVVAWDQAVGLGLVLLEVRVTVEERYDLATVLDK
jgi:hypothetical protein